MSLHPLQRRLLAEELVRRRRSDEYRRQAASQRAARIDPNPHQIDAVIFALGRLAEGGCILADEVGLGKTVEAGLVIAQMLAEGSRRILVVTPKALLGQWHQELYTLFGIESHEVLRSDISFAGEGVFLATRDLAGSEAGAAALAEHERFDLCVIDEAHEVFAGIYKRFDRGGSNREDSPHARLAGRLSTAILGTPVLLLTATPLQNSLLELWGLVHFVDPTGTLLGDISTFRELFCPHDARVLAEGQEHELQQRLATVLQRTLRRQAQDFMREPFVSRQARLFEYTMSAEERALYDDVTTYLLEPNLYAFQGNQRTLLLLGFHRRMASSLPALAASLDRVALRLRNLLARRPTGDAADVAAVAADLEDDDLAGVDLAGAAVGTAAMLGASDHEAATAELARVDAFIERARALPHDSKADALVRAVKLVAEQAEHGRSSGRVVIFTESLTTQEYLRTLLVSSGTVGHGDVTLFRGDNASPRATAALRRWEDEIGATMPPDNRPSPDVALRLALVHEFRTRSRIFISTEAGAKGLNLQFCDTVINYDLPWNPQRIEQRIGRCHRYGQRRDVTVINFIARDNEAQRLTFDILSQKLELFGTVLGATDEVLHRAGGMAPESLASAMGTEFEAQLHRIYERSRTLDEVNQELRQLREAMESRRREFEAAVQRTEEIIQRRFDSAVRSTFRRIQEALPQELAEFDRAVQAVVAGYQQAVGTVAADRSDGVLHLRHPLVVAAVAHARASGTGPWRVRLAPASPEAMPLRGRRGRVRLVRVTHRNFDVTEQLVPVLVLEGDDGPVDVALARELLTAPMEDDPAVASTIAPESLDDALDELLFVSTSQASRLEQPRFERTMAQVERFVADRMLLLQRRWDVAAARLARAQAARDSAIGADQRNAAERQRCQAQEEIDECDTRMEALRAGDDERYRRWRVHAEAQRYSTPQLEHLFEAEIEIA